MRKLTQEIQDKTDKALEKMGRSGARLAEALDNGVPTLAEFEHALSELLGAHGDDCPACVKARMLLAPAVNLTHSA